MAICVGCNFSPVNQNLSGFAGFVVFLPSQLLYSRARKVQKVVAKGLGYSVEKLADV